MPRLSAIGREPLFTAGQIARLSNIADNAGNVLFAVGVVSPLFTSVDKSDWLAILGGIMLTVASWTLSISLAKKGDKS